MMIRENLERGKLKEIRPAEQSKKSWKGWYTDVGFRGTMKGQQAVWSGKIRPFLPVESRILTSQGSGGSSFILKPRNKPKAYSEKKSKKTYKQISYGLEQQSMYTREEY